MGYFSSSRIQNTIAALKQEAFQFGVPPLIQVELRQINLA